MPVPVPVSVYRGHRRVSRRGSGQCGVVSTSHRSRLWTWLPSTALTSTRCTPGRSDTDSPFHSPLLYSLFSAFQATVHYIYPVELHLACDIKFDMLRNSELSYRSTPYNTYTQALSLWERACTVIEEREEKLEDLLTFEKSASNPSRLFAKGTHSLMHLRATTWV